MYGGKKRKENNKKVKWNKIKNKKMFSEVNEHFAVLQSVLGDKRHIKLVFSLKSVFLICF